MGWMIAFSQEGSRHRDSRVLPRPLNYSLLTIRSSLVYKDRQQGMEQPCLSSNAAPRNQSQQPGA